MRLGCRNAWFFSREAGGALAKALGRPPAALLLGPRQCGKSTLARQLLAQRGDAVILDLQDRADRARLQEPELFFEAHRHQLVCLDEIQLLPEFFSRLRAEIDRDRRPGRFLLLGSASGPLLRQSHESLAGRIAQLELTPILLKEERAELIAPVEQAFEARPGIWVRPPP